MTVKHGNDVKAYALSVLTDWARALYVSDATDKAGAEESFRLRTSSLQNGVRTIFTRQAKEQKLFTELEGMIYTYCGEHGYDAALEYFPVSAKTGLVSSAFHQLNVRSNTNTPVPMKSLLDRAEKLQSQRLRGMVYV